MSAPEITAREILETARVLDLRDIGQRTTQRLGAAERRARWRELRGIAADMRREQEAEREVVSR
jgi:hypothetical protein